MFCLSLFLLCSFFPPSLLSPWGDLILQTAKGEPHSQKLTKVQRGDPIHQSAKGDPNSPKWEGGIPIHPRSISSVLPLSFSPSFPASFPSLLPLSLSSLSPPSLPPSSSPSLPFSLLLPPCPSSASFPYFPSLALPYYTLRTLILNIAWSRRVPEYQPAFSTLSNSGSDQSTNVCLRSRWKKRRNFPAERTLSIALVTN